MRAFAALILILGVLPSCSDDPPPDIAGSYAVDVQSGPDGCMLEGFTEGASTFDLTQDAEDPSLVSADINGAIAPFLGLDLGGTEFSGTLDGSSLTLTRTGTQRQTVGCVWRVNGAIDAVIAGDVLSGDITYTGVIMTETADCPFEDDCTSTQSF